MGDQKISQLAVATTIVATDKLPIVHGGNTLSVTPALLAAYGAQRSSVFNVLDYGAAGDGVADDTAAIQAAINAVPATGGIVYLPPGVYNISSTLTAGDGTASLESTKHHIHVIGAGCGTNFTTPNGGTRLYWTGVATGTMMSVLGPIVGASVEGITFDCRGACYIGLNVVHLHKGVLRDIEVNNYTQTGLIITSYPNHLGSGGVGYAASNNHFEGLWLDTSSSSVVGIKVGPSTVSGGIQDICQCTFLNVRVQFYSGTNNIAIMLQYTDACNWINVMCGADFAGIFANAPSDSPGWPAGHTFYNCYSATGGASFGASANWTGTGINLIGWGIGDGEGIPRYPDQVWGWTNTGIPFGYPATPATNQLCNGGLEIWQRGNGPFTASNAYAADRWQIVLAGTDTLSVAREATQKKANSLYSAACAFVLGSGAGATVHRQVLKISDGYHHLLGQTISLRKCVKLSSGVASAVRAYVKTDGTAGTTTYSLYHGNNTNWENLDISEITVPTDATYVEVGLAFAQSCTAYVDNVMLATSVTVVSYQSLSPAQEIEKCQRYYEIISVAGDGTYLIDGYVAGSLTAGWPVVFATRKAVAPTVTVNGTWSINGTTTQPSVAAGASVNGFTFRITNSSASAQYCSARNVGAGTNITAEANP